MRLTNRLLILRRDASRYQGNGHARCYARPAITTLIVKRIVNVNLYK
jgi:hypothetical protein